MSDQERHSKHLYRTGILLVVGLLSIFFARVLLTPTSFGDFGWFRADNVAEQMSPPIRHGGVESCRGCHAAQWDLRSGGAHATVSCESCHAPLASHSDGTKKTAEMVSERSYQLCARCHRRLEARPKDFPQIKPEEHLDQFGLELEPEVCLGCHLPHSPLEDL